jgi:signal transduction histidine kinase
MFQRITDSLFFKGRYNPQNLLGAIGKIIASNIDLSYVSDSVMKEISEQMKISSVILFLCKDKSVFSAKAIGSIKDSGINDGGKLYELIESIVRAPGENILVKDELSESDIKEMMASRRCSILLPLIVQDEIVGAIFLGDKSSGEAYSMEDIELLKILAPQVAVALKNSYLYEQVKEFNLNLQEKIDKATKELVDANKRLMSLDKLKDEFVSIASHELRSPMTIIQGYAWRILYDKNETLSAKNKERVERVYASTQRLIALVNDILDVSRIESGTMLFNNTNFNIAKLAEEIKKEISDSYSKKDLKVSVQNKNVYNVSADRDKIHQVIFNLMDNAIKFTPDGGKIDILFSQDGNYISTTISDSGIGIKESDIGNLFTKFTRLDNSLSPSYRTKGTGLGLYLSKKIVDKSQGTISVTSKFGQGSKFTFTLPKA